MTKLPVLQSTKLGLFICPAVSSGRPYCARFVLRVDCDSPKRPNSHPTSNAMIAAAYGLRPTVAWNVMVNSVGVVLDRIWKQNISKGAALHRCA